jgi:hypothetical protein
MRSFLSIVIVGLGTAALPMTANADCPLFSPDGPACVTPKSKLQVDLAPLGAARLQAQKMLADAQRAMAAPVPTDCKMIRPTDPTFTSKMPVQTPDPNLKLPIQTVPVPSCAARVGSDERK